MNSIDQLQLFQFMQIYFSLKCFLSFLLSTYFSCSFLQLCHYIFFLLFTITFTVPSAFSLLFFSLFFFFKLLYLHFFLLLVFLHPMTDFIFFLFSPSGFNTTSLLYLNTAWNDNKCKRHWYLSVNSFQPTISNKTKSINLKHSYNKKKRRKNEFLVIIIN